MYDTHNPREPFYLEAYRECTNVISTEKPCRQPTILIRWQMVTHLHEHCCHGAQFIGPKTGCIKPAPINVKEGKVDLGLSCSCSTSHFSLQLRIEQKSKYFENHKTLRFIVNNVAWISDQ